MPVCSYRYDDNPQCSNEPTDARVIELSPKDRVCILFCQWHAAAWDAFKWAERKRQANAGR